MKITPAVYLFVMAFFIFFIYGALQEHNYFYLILTVLGSIFLTWKVAEFFIAYSGKSLYQKNKIAARNFDTKFEIKKDYKKINIILDLINGGTEGKSVCGYVKLKNNLTKNESVLDLYQDGTINETGHVGTQISFGIKTALRSFNNIGAGSYTISIDTGDDNIHIQNIKITAK